MQQDQGFVVERTLLSCNKDKGRLASECMGQMSGLCPWPCSVLIYFLRWNHTLSIISLREFPRTQDVNSPWPKAQTSLLCEHVKGKRLCLVFKQVKFLAQAFLWPVTSRSCHRAGLDNRTKGKAAQVSSYHQQQRITRTMQRTFPQGLRISGNSYGTRKPFLWC